MNFFVCIKQVPDVTAPMRVQGGELIQDNARSILNAYDASAVEEAIVLTEKYGGEIDVVLVGPDDARDVVRKALAMGAHRATHIVCEDVHEYDSERFATVLAAFLKDKNYDVVLTGKQSQDTDAGLGGAMIAEKLGLPYAANAVGMDRENDHIIVTRQGDAGQEILEMKTPCLVTCSNDMNNPRIAGPRQVMMSKKKPFETIPLSEVISEIGPSRTRIVSFESLPEREPGVKWEDDPEVLAAKLATALRDDASIL